MFCVNTGTRDLRERWERRLPAPVLDELEPEAIGEADGVSVGESGGGWRLPVGLAQNLDR
jgi:hypothetical protein